MLFDDLNGRIVGRDEHDNGADRERWEEEEERMRCARRVKRVVEVLKRIGYCGWWWCGVEGRRRVASKKDADEGKEKEGEETLRRSVKLLVKMVEEKSCQSFSLLKDRPLFELRSGADE